MVAQQIHPLGKKALLHVISDPFICISYSQFGEDSLIKEFLFGNSFVNRLRFYVDIGAYLAPTLLFWKKEADLQLERA